MGVSMSPAQMRGGGELSGGHVGHVCVLERENAPFFFFPSTSSGASASDGIWQLVCISLSGDLMPFSLSLAPHR